MLRYLNFIFKWIILFFHYSTWQHVTLTMFDLKKTKTKEHTYYMLSFYLLIFIIYTISIKHTIRVNMNNIRICKLLPSKFQPFLQYQKTCTMFTVIFHTRNVSHIIIFLLISLSACISSHSFLEPCDVNMWLLFNRVQQGKRHDWVVLLSADKAKLFKTDQCFLKINNIILHY